MNITVNMKPIEDAVRLSVNEAIDLRSMEEFNRKATRVEADAHKTLAELITENDLEQFSDLSFDWFDDPLGVVFIPCMNYAIMARSAWTHDTENRKYSLYAEYALYTAHEMTGITKDSPLGGPIYNDLRYDAVYTLESICTDKFENIALAVAHATAQVYMKGE